MKRPVWLAVITGVAIVLAWGGYRAYRASRNLVTLEVRNADLRKVAREIEWQTWERILVHNDLTGKVTLNVKDAPLEEVLNIIEEQLSCRWTTIYPLYSSSRSIKAFKQIQRGELTAAENGWTNLNARGMFRGGGRGGMMGGGMFADPAQGPKDKVSFNFAGQDVDITILAFGRFAQTQVVPEDGTEGKVYLRLDEVPIQKAVAKLAKGVHRNWDVFYTLQPGGGFARGDGPPRGGRGQGGGPPPGVFPGDPNFVVASLTNTTEADSNRLAALAQARQERFEQAVKTLPQADQQRIQEDQQRRDDMRNMTPEERQQRMQEMGSRPEVQQRMEARARSGLVNSTPEQRVDRARRVVEMRQRFQQRQNQNPPNR
jgi:type II secretory pathway component GspD/PulD (secretin)